MARQGAGVGAPPDRVLDLPKVELHLHLDLSMSFEVAATLCPDLTVERYRRELQGPARCADLATFLASTRRQVELLQDAAALELLTADVVAGLAAEQVVHAELRFAPMLHTQAGMHPRAAVEAVTGAAATAASLHGISVGLILSTLRHLSTEQSVATARMAVDLRHDGVAGFDLAGDELGCPLQAHLPAFDVVRDAGLSYTVHAGEAAGASSVLEVLDALDPPRIGHGVRSVEDPAVVERLVERGTHLEVCPTCNVQLGVVPSIGAHPVDDLYRRGVSLGISTDSRTATVTSLRGEYAALEAAFGWGVDELRDVNAMAADAAFVPESARRQIRARLDGDRTTGVGP